MGARSIVRRVVPSVVPNAVETRLIETLRRLPRQTRLAVYDVIVDAGRVHGVVSTPPANSGRPSATLD